MATYVELKLDWHLTFIWLGFVYLLLTKIYNQRDNNKNEAWIFKFLAPDYLIYRVGHMFLPTLDVLLLSSQLSQERIKYFFKSPKHYLLITFMKSEAKLSLNAPISISKSSGMFVLPTLIICPFYASWPKKKKDNSLESPEKWLMKIVL